MGSITTSAASVRFPPTSAATEHFVFYMLGAKHGGVVKDRPAYWLIFGLVWLGLGIDKVFFHPRDLPFDYLSLVIAFASLGMFTWLMWKRRRA